MINLKQELKTLIVNECYKDYAPEAIGDEQILLGPELDIDSLDALQICMALQTHYGVRVEGSNTARKILKNINSLASYIEKHRQQ